MTPSDQPPIPPLPPVPQASVPLHAVVSQPTNGFAIASMVLGIVWVWWIGSILALIFGILALRQINRSQGWQRGRGMAIAGIVLGAVGMVTLALVAVIAASTADEIDDELDEINACAELWDEWADTPTGSAAEATVEARLDAEGCR